jgi:uncharacterized protein (TIGR02687 family)
MLKDKIQDYFQRYSSLRVLFFFDEDEEYRSEVSEMDLENIHKAAYGNNAFSLKWKLVSEWKEEKVFLYLPIKQPTTQKDFLAFPLMGLLIANKVLQLDDVGGFMEQYSLQRHQKSLVAKYMKELKYTGVQEVCTPILSASNFQESALQRGLVSAFFKFKQMESWSLLTAKFITLSNKEGEKEFLRVVKKIKDLGFEEEVSQQLQKVVGLPVPSLSQAHLRKLAQGVLYNQLTQGMEAKGNNDPYAELKVQDSSQLTHLNQMLHEVDRSSIRKPFTQLLGTLSSEIKGESLVEVYGEEAEFAEYTSDMIWAILKRIHPQITESPTHFIKRMEQISLQAQIKDSVRQGIRYLVQVAKAHHYISENTQYILDRPEEYLQQYTASGFKVDGAYRKAVKTFKTLAIEEIPENISLEEIHQTLNVAYEKHTDQLNREWLKCLNHFKFDYKQINIPKQYDFYKTEIATADQKVVVIISDALRYEAAQELLSEMHGDTKNTAEMRYMLASIPSKTNIGMSQLLPGKKAFNGGEITSDGISTSGTENRGSILKQIDDASMAIQFSDLEGKPEKWRREVFKKQVVYVYHDVIDSTGDKRASERRTFDAVTDTIEEIKRFVKNLHASMNVAKVYITADHGFIYNDREIAEKDKETMPVKDAMHTHNRYFITDSEQEINLGYSIPLRSTTAFNENLWVNIPYSVNRYKKQGVGHQFAHGGGSLQELVIPLIESSRQIKPVSKKVKPMLINPGRMRIVSNILKVNILQETEVSRFEKERTVLIGLYKENQLMSNQASIDLNFTSEAPSDRMARIDLVIAPEAADESFLKLKIFDKEDMLNPIIEERVKNNTLSQQDF